MTWYDLPPLGKQFIPDYNSAKCISTGQVFVIVIIECELLHSDGQYCTYVHYFTGLEPQLGNLSV